MAADPWRSWIGSASRPPRSSATIGVDSSRSGQRSTTLHGVERLVVGAIPTLDMWDASTGATGVRGAHMFFLAQPSDFPERVILADPDMFFGHFLTMSRSRRACRARRQTSGRGPSSGQLALGEAIVKTAQPAVAQHPNR
jgi:hypothetical protein